MKKRSLVAGLVVALLLYSAMAEPGGTYTLTGEEKGIAEIIKADMQQFPDLYKGESRISYTSKFKKENQIGRRKLNPGDQLRFPETMASIKAKKSSQRRKKATAAAIGKVIVLDPVHGMSYKKKRGIRPRKQILNREEGVC